MTDARDTIAGGPIWCGIVNWQAHWVKAAREAVQCADLSEPDRLVCEMSLDLASHAIREGNGNRYADCIERVQNLTRKTTNEQKLD